MVQFPEPKPLTILEIGDGMDHRPMTYDVSNPHPMYGKDPNIINQLGHTEYPKMIYPQGKDQPGIVVKNKKEEEAALGKPEEEKSEQKPEENLKDDIAELEAKLAAAKAAKEHKPEHQEDDKEHPWS